MAKPIFLVKVPPFTPTEHYRFMYDHLSHDLPDYHILIVRHGGDNIEFQAFYDKDLIETDFETFKQKVNQLINEAGE